MMSGPSDDDREAIDRAFAELVAGYHMTADRPDPLPPLKIEPDPPSDPPLAPRVEEHQRLVDPQPRVFDLAAAGEPDEPFVPEPPPPLPRPALPVLLAWIGLGYAAVVVLLASFGVRLPPWAGWLALAGFVGGFAVLVARLPRSRPPDAGDGAVL
jgi:hypothetical protein